MTERFCPSYCLFDCRDSSQQVAENCHHQSDVRYDNPINIQVMKWRNHWEDAQIIGENEDSYYLSTGGSVFKNSVLIRPRET